MKFAQFVRSLLGRTHAAVVPARGPAPMRMSAEPALTPHQRLQNFVEQTEKMGRKTLDFEEGVMCAVFTPGVIELRLLQTGGNRITIKIKTESGEVLAQRFMINRKLYLILGEPMGQTAYLWQGNGFDSGRGKLKAEDLALTHQKYMEGQKRIAQDFVDQIYTGLGGVFLVFPVPYFFDLRMPLDNGKREYRWVFFPGQASIERIEHNGKIFMVMRAGEKDARLFEHLDRGWRQVVEEDVFSEVLGISVIDLPVISTADLVGEYIARLESGIAHSRIRLHWPLSRNDLETAWRGIAEFGARRTIFLGMEEGNFEVESRNYQGRGYLLLQDEKHGRLFGTSKEGLMELLDEPGQFNWDRLEGISTSPAFSDWGSALAAFQEFVLQALKHFERGAPLSQSELVLINPPGNDNPKFPFPDERMRFPRELSLPLAAGEITLRVIKDAEGNFIVFKDKQNNAVLWEFDGGQVYLRYDEKTIEAAGEVSRATILKIMEVFFDITQKMFEGTMEFKPEFLTLVIPAGLKSIRLPLLVRGKAESRAIKWGKGKHLFRRFEHEGQYGMLMADESGKFCVYLWRGRGYEEVRDGKEKWAEALGYKRTQSDPALASAAKPPKKVKKSVLKPAPPVEAIREFVSRCMRFLRLSEDERTLLQEFEIPVPFPLEINLPMEDGKESNFAMQVSAGKLVIELQIHDEENKTLTVKDSAGQVWSFRWNGRGLVFKEIL